MKQLTTIRVAGQDLKLLEMQYSSGRVALALETSDGEPWCTASVNVPEATLEDGEILIRTWNENAVLRQPLLDTGLFEDTGKRVPTGFVEAEVWVRKQVH